MSVDVAYQKYLRHQKGLALLWFWMEQWKDLRGWSWSNAELRLSALASQRFLLGSPRSRRGVKQPVPFVGVQSDEAAWIKRIEWKRAVWDPSIGVLWLVSAVQKSPDVSWPDLPSFAVGLTIDPVEKMGQWAGPKLGVRGVWWDEESVLHVDLTPSSTLGVKVGPLSEHWNKAERQNIETLRDVVVARLNNSNVDLDPGFQGERPMVGGEYADLVKPFEEKGKGVPVEYKYPEIFGQFLYGMDGEDKPTHKR